MAGTVLRLSSSRAPSKLVRAFLAIDFEPFAYGKYGSQVARLKPKKMTDLCRSFSLAGTVGFEPTIL